MKYLKADEILPKELLKEIQRYVEGGILYIPKCHGPRKKWGENSGGAAYYRARNEEIRDRFHHGISITRLSELYGLSLETIRKIVYAKN
ncbi:CD3324 family protein [Paenibacillus durus]|uniref:Mor transcription activator domain-containing protein n=1 Tax=Paenibacillus durus ATCC 35681 TaxID=1333534 RepID=A0A0F7F8S1_PAEDU|nr:CD3324 family protein [Paenibacillus durus]AKG34623.1 hypothetical protein VK70_08550 [Paenibacillus durus ATCC 35681]